MDDVFGFIFYVIFDVIFFRIGKWVIKIATLRRIEVTLNGTSQPLVSLIGLFVVIGVVWAVIYFVRN